MLKGLVAANIGALCINGVLVWLTIIKNWPPFLIVCTIAVILGLCIWLSCYANGKLPHQSLYK